MSRVETVKPGAGKRSVLDDHLGWHGVQEKMEGGVLMIGSVSYHLL